jgi:hypothetical protein
VSDTTGLLKEWIIASGTKGGFCNWKGVLCTNGTSTVYSINIWYETLKGITGLRGKLPPASAFQGLSNLTSITIGDQAGITGTLPADWSRLQQMEELWLGNNGLTGTIPSSWGSVVGLKVLYLFKNLPISSKANFQRASQRW